ncbi:MAG TPA: STAS domain-containing protein [Solirubrobacteraceae bacterium]|nr:STAS domain-containing protein [Solirubrobacteraceae bacterium]
MFFIGEDAQQEVPGAALLIASGELDYTSSPLLRRQVLDQLAGGRTNLVFDFSEVTFIDSTAIGELVGAFMRAQQAGGGSVRVVCASHNERVLRIFDIVGVASLIPLHRSREEALLALATAPHTAIGSELERRRLARREGGRPALAGAAVARTYAQHAAGARAEEREPRAPQPPAPAHLDELA